MKYSLNWFKQDTQHTYLPEQVVVVKFSHASILIAVMNLVWILCYNNTDWAI